MSSGAASNGALLALLRRWRWRRAAAGSTLGAGVAILAVALWRAGDGAASEALVIGVCGGLAGLLPWVWERRSRAAQLERLARHLDRARTELTESTGLLLAEPSALTPLANLQRQRTMTTLGGLPRRGVLPWRRPVLAMLVGGLCVLAAAGLQPSKGKFVVSAAVAPGATAGAARTEVRVRSVTVAPPAYTARPPHEAQELNVSAEQGARVAWKLALSGPADHVALLFGDEVVPFSASSDGLFAAERVASTSELYAVRVEAGGREVWRSPSARFEVVPDRPPVLDIRSPLALTEVSATAPGSLELSGVANDDYAIGAVDLMVTTVAGGGEQISVRESHQALALDAGGQFSLTLDLAALGVQMDTELYLRVEATDRKTPVPNRTRSETLRVRAAGPVALAASGLDAGVRLQPVLEFFRSQRQIILDTEKLIADQPHIARAEFEQRAQSLAFDQRSLRMRYGALLGEEFESGAVVEAGAEDVEHLQEPGGDEPRLPGAEQDDTAAQHPRSLGRPKAPPKIEDLLPAGLVHQHDAQDQATFFTSELRTQLKAVLAEMWSAEGALRIFDPKHALPFESRALVLLKELQQKARVYVPKIGYEAPEIDLARRLTGELDKIHDLAPVGAPARPEAQAEIRRVLTALRQGDGGSRGSSDSVTEQPSAADIAVARRVLAQSALAGDADALVAVDALRVLESSPSAAANAALDEAQRRTLERALWKTLPPPLPAPTAPAAGGGLASALRSVSGGGQ
ncbi:MAG: hypothetical protein ABI609_01700 [Acidobacteriota bacterium]